MPVNVNYNYAPREVAELFDYLRPSVVIYHQSFGPKFADVLPPDSARLLIVIDDPDSIVRASAAYASPLTGSGSSPVSRSTCVAQFTNAYFSADNSSPVARSST